MVSRAAPLVIARAKDDDFVVICFCVCVLLLHKDFVVVFCLFVSSSFCECIPHTYPNICLHTGMHRDSFGHNVQSNMHNNHQPLTLT